MNKKIKLFILSSVLLNIVLSGLVLGHISHQIERNGFFNYRLNTLSAEKKQAFDAIITKMQQDNAPLYKEIRNARENIAAILKQDVFDADAYQQAIDRLSALQKQQRQNLTNIVKQLAGSWLPEERAVLVKMLKRKSRPPEHEAQKEEQNNKPVSSPLSGVK